ncbi:MAG: hypothetical protein FK731_12885, partial [Asgard group archaeon]|nr:hypothetical protein [Asgard group archaeon]
EFANFDDDGGSTEAIDIQDDIAYIANQDQGLEILNITNPSKPEKLSCLDTIGSASEVHVKDDYVYVSHSSQGIDIINVQNPKKPFLVSNIRPGGIVREVIIRDNLLHIITSYSGFYLYDIRDPYNPVYVSHWDSFMIHYGISVLNKYICLATWGFGLEILDLTFTSSPILIGYWNESLSPTLGVFAAQIGDQKIAFLASSNKGLEIIDFTNPFNPVKIGSYYLSGTFHDVFVKDSIAYCSTYDHGLVLVDITDLTEPVEITTYNTDGYTVDCDVENNLCAIADRSGGVKIFDVQDPNDIILLSQFFDHGFASKIKIQDDLVFVADRIGGLELFDMSNPLKPRKISQYRRSGFNALDVLIQDDLALISAYSSGLEFVNISNLNNPVKIATYYNDNYIRTCIKKDNLVFIGSLNKTLEVIDISLLPTISYVGQFTFSKENPNVEVLEIIDDILIAGYSEGCKLLNISNPSSITEIATFSNSYPMTDFVLDNNLLFCANGYNGLQILDITNNQFTQISNFDTVGFARDILKDDDIIYIATQTAGIDVVNISNILNPIDIGDYTQKSCYGIVKRGLYLFSCSWDEGLLVLALDSDSDTLIDLDEIEKWGTDPFNADSDFDEMPDNFEIKYNLDPLNNSDASLDPDNDDLTNVEEYLQIFFYEDSTNPYNADTDYDKMPDGWEVEHRLNPLLANGEYDADFDYLTNYEEYLLGTNPREKDTDNDDSDDGLEVLFNTDPLNPKDNPVKRRLIRVVIILSLGFVLVIIGTAFLIRKIKRRIARNIEREKRIEEAEDEILLF